MAFQVFPYFTDTVHPHTVVWCDNQAINEGYGKSEEIPRFVFDHCLSSF